MTTKYIFLVYVGRSGSTLLARLLHEKSRDIVAMPETRLLEYLIAAGDDRLKAMNDYELMRFINCDYQLKNLRLSEEELLSAVKKSMGGGVYEIFNCIVQAFAKKINKPDGKIVIVKLGQLLHMYKALNKIFDSPDFLYIERDPRAVASSLLRTQRAYHYKGSMGRGDIIYISNYWKAFTRKIKGLADRKEINVIFVRYEDLCIDEQGVLDGVCRELNVAGGLVSGSGYNIGVQEMALHKLVMGNVDDKRIVAWKNELPLWQGCVLERAIGRDMRPYNTYYNNTSRWAVLFYYFYAYIIHILSGLLFMLKKAKFYMCDTNQFVQHVRLLIARKKYG